jgi:hypothetical protein
VKEPKLKADQKRWDERFGGKGFAFGQEANPFLRRHIKLFQKGKALDIHTSLTDLDSYQIEKEKYDLIANFYFLNRRLIPKMKHGLKKGGRVIFETYTLEQRKLGTGGPKHAKYFLKPNELLKLFKDFRILFYREGIFKEGGRRKAVASLIAEKI